MRKIFIINILLLFSVVSWAQSWEKTYPNPSKEEAKAITRIGSNYYLGINGENNEVLIQKTDALGVLVFKKKVANGQLIQMQRAENQSATLFLIHQSDTTKLYKVNDSGNVIDSFSFGTTAFLAKAFLQDKNNPNKFYVASITANPNAIAVTQLEFMGGGQPTNVATFMISDSVANCKNLSFKRFDADTSLAIVANINNQKTRLVRFKMDGTFGILSNTLLSPNAYALGSEVIGKDSLAIVLKQNNNAKLLIYSVLNNSIINNSTIWKADVKAVHKFGNSIFLAGNTTNKNLFYEAFDLAGNFIKGDSTTYNSLETAQDIWSDTDGVTVVGARNARTYANHNFPKNYYIKGKVIFDKNNNCLADASDSPLSGWYINAFSNGQNNYMTSNSNGEYSYNVQPNAFVMSVIVPDTNIWQPCGNNFVFSITQPDTVIVNFFIKEKTLQPKLEVNALTFGLIQGATSPYLITYENKGTAAAQNAYIDLALHADLDFISSSKSSTSQGNNTYRFQIGNIPIGAKDTFFAFIKPKITANIGQAFSVEARIYPDDILPKPANWSGAYLRATAVCENGKIRLKIKNIGDTPSEPNLQYIVIDDELMIKSASFPNAILPNQEILLEEYTANGHFFRLDMAQEPGFPYGNRTSAGIEACGAPANFGNFLKYPLHDDEPFRDIECHALQGILSKPVVPTAYIYAVTQGVGNEHFIDSNQVVLTYYVGLYNGGNTTLTNIKMTDTLSNLVEKTSVVNIGEAPYASYLFENEGVVKYDFGNAVLAPDKIAYCAFTVKTKKGLLDGDKIKNKATFFVNSIPYVTQEVFHTIKKNWVILPVTATKDILQNVSIKIFPNPFDTEATILIESEQNDVQKLLMYDMAGRLVKNIETNGAPLIKVQRDDLANGMYLLFALDKNGKKVFSGKLIVE